MSTRPSTDQRIAPAAIDSAILRKIDGNARIIKMGDFIDFQNKIGAILHRKMPTKKMPERDFKALVALEAKIPEKERDAILHKFIHQFAQIMQHNVFDDLKMVQSEVNKIIEEWSQQRGRPDTLVAVFGTKEYQADHEKGLLAYVTTLKEFDTLLEDLYLFFEDLMCSLPKSYHLYQEALQKSNEQGTEQHESTT